MENRINPFHELYLTESIGPDKYVELFSPYLVDKVLELFQPGHVILKGLQGSGKSMLLGLLKPSVRIAFAREGVPFPVPPKFKMFIGAGIHLIRDGVSDFGQRSIPGDNSFEQSPYLFADFLNYWLVIDILQSIRELSNPELGLADEIGIGYNKEKLDKFAKDLKSDACWFGYLDEVGSYDDLISTIRKRIQHYLAFLNFNTDTLPDDILSTKTRIGKPLLACTKLLRLNGIIANKTEIFVRIDQFEELKYLEDLSSIKENSFREQIHKLLGMRDDAVSYRIGTRNFSWEDGGKMFGTTAPLEKFRNYNVISLDNILRRKENPRTKKIFKEFAEDIFIRRLELSNYGYHNDNALEQAFGKSDVPSVKANHYVKTNKHKAVVVDEDWPEEWKKFLFNLAELDPLSARLGEAWCRQKAEEKKAVMFNVPKGKPYPWDKQWWRKERIDQALLQIASRNQQRIDWYGADDVISLSGSNILAFLIIAQRIWNVWMRDNEANSTGDQLPRFSSEIQAIAIREASAEWFEKVLEERGGVIRQNFIHNLGNFFYEQLVNDEAMSYPGYNGISIALSDFKNHPEVKTFLQKACDYGDLYDRPHTSKHKKDKQRWKWHLNPILSPQFKIPEAHTKEPGYVKAADVKEWIELAKGNKKFVKKKRIDRSTKKNDGQINIDYDNIE